MRPVAALTASSVLGGSSQPLKGRMVTSRKMPHGAGRRRLVTTALFEKFTERSIKSIMIAQAEARAFGAQEVSAFGGFAASLSF